MTPESKFKTWLVTKLRDYGAFVQTLETTTGRGVPDLMLMYDFNTYLWEIKACEGSCVLRPEQYAWHRRALNQSISVLTIQYNPKKVVIHTHNALEAKPASNGWKLQRDRSYMKFEIEALFDFYL